MLSVATERSTEVAALKAGALQAMALDYRAGIQSTQEFRVISASGRHANELFT